jgi:hydroxyacylglutathione hydrolase
MMAASDVVDFTAAAPVRGDLDVRWIHGARKRKSSTDPVFQVHAYDRHTYVLRQSKTVSAEAPFLYLLFGNDRALLLDTGAGQQSPERPLRGIVDGLISGWLAEHPRESYQLVVAHTHGHGDHVAGDGQFADRPQTTVVSRELPAVQEFFGFTDWPGQVVQLDLGGRLLEITGSPGHHRAAITVYDPWTGFLLTGDTVLPGRLFAFDYPEFLASLDRLVEFAGRRPVTYVLGCHIEMTRQPGRDYPLGCTYQPDEPPLQMTVQQLTAVREAAKSVAGQPGSHPFDDFLIMNGPYRGYVVKLIARSLWARIWPRKPRSGPASVSRPS